MPSNTTQHRKNTNSAALKSSSPSLLNTTQHRRFCRNKVMAKNWKKTGKISVKNIKQWRNGVILFTLWNKSIYAETPKKVLFNKHFKTKQQALKEALKYMLKK